MIQWFITLFPIWMRPDHPLLRPLINNHNQKNDSHSIQFSRVGFYVLIIASIVIGNYLIISDNFQNDQFDLPISQLLVRLIWGPMFILQSVMQLGAAILAIETVSESERRQSWDDIRSTTGGAGLLLRTRWSFIVFYRFKGLWGILIGARLIMIMVLLYDLTAFRGEYLRNLMDGHVIPALPQELGIGLLACMIAASLLLPFTGLGVDVAFGLLISTSVRQRTFVVLAQVSVVVLRVAILLGLLFGLYAFGADRLQTSPLIKWLMMVMFAVIGDWGLSFLYLGFFGSQVWVNIPYGIFISIAILFCVVIQSVFIDKLLSLATYRAD